MADVSATIHAVALETDGNRDFSLDLKYILAVCSNLVVLDKNMRRFRFAHASVIEYLKQKKKL